MSPRRREVEISVERALGSPDAPEGVIRLTARFEPTPSGETPSAAELKAAVVDLTRELEAILGPAPPRGGPARVDRGLAELVETYRPRQRVLVDLLRDEGELTEKEHAVLISSLPGEGVPPVGRAPAATAAPPTPGRASGGHVSADLPRGLPPARPVPELLREYQITSLRQAGAVRARRQISFAEYMALKRHFESASPSGPDEARGRSSD